MNASKIMVQVHIYSNMVSIDLCVIKEGIKYMHVHPTCSIHVNYRLKSQNGLSLYFDHHRGKLIAVDNPALKQDELFFFLITHSMYRMCVECVIRNY